MPAPPLPTPLAQVAHRRFSFYPCIRGIQHNDWIYLRATWSEILVVNAKSGIEVSIPRHFLGEVSEADHPLVIVGLLKDLEYLNGAILPHQRRIIEMPMAVGGETCVPSNRGPAPVIAISLDSGGVIPTKRILVGAVVAGVIVSLVIAGVIRDAQAHPRGFHAPARYRTTNK
jgi:hypothetical protein